VLFSRVDALRLVELDQLMDSITAPTTTASSTKDSTSSTTRSFAALFEKLYAQYGIHTQVSLHSCISATATTIVPLPMHAQ
jgi:adenine C2-methylase RlmN of 23S rRNA A2503 and tRNA A37